MTQNARSRPAALTAIDAPVVDVASDPRLKHRLGDRHGEQIVLRRFEVTESLREDAEGPINRSLDDDLTTDSGCICLCLDSPSVGCSTTSL